MTTSTLDQAVEGRLRSSGVRYTAARRAVVAVLNRASGPLSAGEIHEEAGGEIPLSSVYRTLNVLEESGILVPHFGVKGLTRYELAEWIAGHHHHLVCSRCGSVEDVDVPSGMEARVTAVVEDLAALASFDPTNHLLEIEGTCIACR